MQIFILGMHSSGASCIARLINMMGVYFSPEDKALKQQALSPKALWEREDVVSLNNKILKEAGGRWDLVTSLDFTEIDSKKRKAISQDIQSIIFGLEANRPWFLKDPRLCLVLQEWTSSLSSPVYVVVHRNPIRVAQSLKDVHGIPEHVGLALWEHYMISTLNAIKGNDFLSVRYEDILQNPIKEVGILYDSFLSMGVQGIRLPSDREISEYITTGLSSNSNDEPLLSEFLNSNQLDLIEILNRQKSIAENGEIKLSRASTIIIEDYNEIIKNKDELTKKTDELKNILNELQNLQSLAAAQKSVQDNLLTTQEKLEQQNQTLEKTQDELHEITLKHRMLLSEKKQFSLHKAAFKEKIDDLTVEIEELRNDLGNMKLALLKESTFGDLQFLTRLNNKLGKIPGGKNAGSRVQAAIEKKRVQDTVALLQESGLFDNEYYISENEDLDNSEIDPLVHFVMHGVFEGRRPNKFFDPPYYIQENPDIIDKGVNPLVHYLVHGWLEGRNPSDIFDTTFYLESYPDVRTSGTNPLSHYLEIGIHEGRSIRYIKTPEESFSEILPVQPIERSSGLVEYKPPVKVITFYLPQFHEIPENNLWWGDGFTEWSNVKPAKPLFPDHYQPHVPGNELGYYDLSSSDAQQKQIELAKLYGVGGFCFYFYWFASTRLLEKPLLNYLENMNLDFPFCLCWANENWCRRWDGMEEDILIAQEHTPEDDLEFISYISKYLADPRYIRVNGKPLLLVYRPSLLPDCKETLQRWRKWCRDNGIGEIYLAYTQSFESVDPDIYGFDAAVEFPPNNTAPPNITSTMESLPATFDGYVFDWSVYPDRSRNYHPPRYKLFRGVNCSWDNTARRKTSGTIFKGSSPLGYQEWLHNAAMDTIRRFDNYHNLEERLIFVNAWNEWAEGAHLEPDKRYGYAFLEATRTALIRAGLKSPVHVLADQSANETKVPVGFAVIVHAYYPDVFEELLQYVNEITAKVKLFVTTTREKEDQIKQLLDEYNISFSLLVVENRGRDILPFLKVMKQVVNENYDLFVKIHTKKSKHREDGEKWRNDLYNKLLLPENVDTHLQYFLHRPDVGMIGPKGHIVGMSTYSGSNEENVMRLAARMGLTTQKTNELSFVAGSMFFCRTKALYPLLNLAITDKDFEDEDGQVDGTFAHALERAFTISLCASGYKLADTDNSLLGDTTFEKEKAQDYQFAKKTK